MYTPYKLCPAMLCTAIQSHCGILSCDTYITVSVIKTVYKTTTKNQNIFSAAAAVHQMYLSEGMHPYNRYFKSALFEIYLADYIPVGNG